MGALTLIKGATYQWHHAYLNAPQKASNVSKEELEI